MAPPRPQMRALPTQQRSYTSSPLAAQPPLKTSPPAPSSAPAPAPASFARPRPTNASPPADRDHFDESRHSGVGTFGVGLGLLSDSMSDDESDDDDDDKIGSLPPSPGLRSDPKPAVPFSAPVPVGLGIRAPEPVNPDAQAKHRALVAAMQLPSPTAGPTTPTASYNPYPSSRAPAPPPLNLQTQPQMTQIPPPHTYSPYLSPPPPSHQSPNNYSSNPSSPLLAPQTRSPHPLPPSSPITPLFAAPPMSVRFDTPQTSPFSIMRGDTESSLPTRNKPKPITPAMLSPSLPIPTARPPKSSDGDDFWRRFSTIAHTEARKPADLRRSPWLRARLRTSRLTSRLALFFLLLFVSCLAGGIACAWIFTHKAGDGPDVPVAVGGSEGNSGIATTSSVASVQGWIPPDRRSAAVEVEVDMAFMPRETGPAMMKRHIPHAHTH